MISLHPKLQLAKFEFLDGFYNNDHHCPDNSCQLADLIS